MCAWFQDGWYNFVRYNSVSLLDTFWSSMYKKNSRFRILILDWTACEINYPSKNEGSKHDKQNSEFQDDRDSEDCFEISYQRMPAKRSGQSPDLIENLKVKNKCELKARSSKRKTWWRKWIRWWWYWLWFVAFTYINGNLCGQKTQSFSRNQESSQNCQITESGKPYIHGYVVVKGHKVQMSGKLLNKVWSTSFFWYIFS